MSSRPPAARGPFRVYVEGPRDRDILQGWARRLAPPLARRLQGVTVILGGRQPARAVSDLRARREADPSAHGLCVLDADNEAPPEPASEPGLEFFTWSLRHIESYLLVPRALRVALRVPDDDARFGRLMRDHLPEADSLASFDAKRLLGPHGPLVRHLGRPLSHGRVARAMRPEDLHPDVHALLDRLRAALGVEEAAADVTTRSGALGARSRARGILG